MPKTRIFLAFTALVLASLACNALSLAEATSTPVIIVEPTNPPQPSNLPATEADVPRVSLEQALVALNAGAAVIVDVRSSETFALSHIASAISIPLDTIEANPTGLNLDKDQWIITYCT